MDSYAVPSLTGAAATGIACKWIPMAWPLAVMQGLVISDPGQMWDASESYKGLAEKAKNAIEELNAAVAKYQDSWEGTDRDKFIADNVKPYSKALQETANMHNGVSGSMNLMGDIYMGIGVLSALLGAFMVACAIAVAGTPPPFDLATFGVANEAAAGSNGVFRGLLLKLQALILRTGIMLKQATSTMPALKVGAVFAGVAGVAGYAGYSDLDGNKSAGDKISWPGATDAGSGAGQNPGQGTGQDPAST
jgi:uncharacterized protein YukE